MGKRILFTLILMMIIFSIFAAPDVSRKIIDSKNNFPAFSQIKQIKSSSAFFEYLKDFVSWKHWRYWLGLVVSIFIWFVFIMVNGSFQELFSAETQKKFVAKEGRYYLFWLGYSFIITLIFSFGYNYLLEFVTNLRLLAIPQGEHWLIWILWGGLLLLSLGAVWALIREIVIFKLKALYTIPYQILHGVIGMVLVFFLTTAVIYFIIGVGIVLGIIIIVGAGLTILFFFLKQKPTYSSSELASEDPNKAINEQNKKRNEDQKRWKDQQEKFNREQMKKTRGW